MSLMIQTGTRATSHSALKKVVLVAALVFLLFARFAVAQEPPQISLRPSGNVSSLKVAADLELDLLLQEPTVANPLYLNFDERGRLWVVQYRQYPWPAGLKLISRDNVWRNVYDPPFPPPPPHAADSPFRGKDLITIHEDTDGDGEFDRHKTFLEGLNLATAALKGRGGVFVMNPPYLLFYADANEDDLPDSPHPKLLLSGFGIEDTHSIANSLRWGPDGWIYGTEGSTVSAAVVRHGPDGNPIANEKPIHSMGQNIWRYHPELHRYEIFAEGGGNAFGVEFDSSGRVYSGHNGGDTRGFHYVQGGYYLKNFGKHGLHSNPYTFAYYPAMKHHAVERFSHTFEIYEADALPAYYHGKLISISPILHYVMASEISPDGSTRQTRDVGPIVMPGSEERDNWFTPVDIQTGPDGSLYVADWYSVQSNHYRNHEGQTNPDLGRVYRLRSAGLKSLPDFDLGKCASEELVRAYLSHANRWYRETALRILADRKDQSMVPTLRGLATDDQNPNALEALWGLNVSGGFDEPMIRQLLQHSNPAVRAWTIRLAADASSVPDGIAHQMAAVARDEKDAEVRLQLACSCRRLEVRQALHILQSLLIHSEDAQDTFIPNALWWAVESHADQRDEVVQWLEQTELWQAPLCKSANLIENLMRRYASLGTQDDLLLCAALLRQAPNQEQKSRLISGFTRAFEGRSIPPLPTELIAELSRVEGRFAIILSIRQKDETAIEVALEKIRDAAVPEIDRLQYIRALGEVQALHNKCVPALLELFETTTSVDLATACLTALQHFDSQAIGSLIVQRFSDLAPVVQETAQAVLASRQNWSEELVRAIGQGFIDKRVINQDTIARLRWHHDAAFQTAVTQLFPDAADDISVLDQRIELVEKIALAGNGNPLEGQKLFHESANCGKCHQIFGRGGSVGPDLTSYNRSNLRLMLLAIVNPSAEIREGFENMTILTDDGRVVTGFKIEENNDRLVLRSADGQSHTIEKQSIDEQHQNTKSLMPTGLLDGLSDTQLRDLCAFLTSTTPPN